MASLPPVHESKVGPFQFIILVLSVFVLVVLTADTVLKLPVEVSRTLQGIDLLTCVVFFLDFCARFWRADSKLAFMKWGWIDLLACVPNIDVLRVGRLVRVLRVIQLLRGIRSFHRLLQIVFQNKLQGGIASVALATFFVIVFASVSILMYEQAPGATIKTAEDALWWSITTITTVGYGDTYPVTPEGRVIAIGVMLAGVGLFGSLSGLVASLFLGAKPDERSAELKQILARIDQLEERLQKQNANRDMSG